jgi:hypothetical protein
MTHNHIEFTWNLPMECATLSYLIRVQSHECSAFHGMIPRELHVIMRHGFIMEFSVYCGVSTDRKFNGNPCDYAAMDLP